MKELLRKILLGIKNLFSKATEETKHLLPICIGIANGLKKFMDSPLDEIAIGIVGFALPKASPFFKSAVESVKKRLPSILLTLEMVDAVSKIDDPNERLRKIIELFKLSSNEAQNKAYHDLCTMVLADLSDGKLTWQEASALSQYYYDNIYKMQYRAD
jgi:hypothetical protein